MAEKKIIIAVDGHSSCGKSTIAKDLAKALKYVYIDTGAMYRSVTLYAMQNGIIENGIINEEKLKKELDNIEISFKYNDKTGKSETWLNGENVEDKIRTMEVSRMVSPISKIGFVRQKLVDLQRKMGENKGIVMDGRDIGTVVFPNAEVKFFVTASLDVRAKRRYEELKQKKQKITLEEVKKNLAERDKIDSTRKISPLKKADDAIVLDNSNMTITQQLEWALNKVNEKLKQINENRD